MNKGERSELRWVIVWAAVVVLLASLPYVWGMYSTPPGYEFVGLTHNIDDGAVYLSWMRQAADGHFFIRNLFTNEPQAARQFNVLFLVMGWFAALSHVPLVVVFHLARIILGFVLILGIWQFSKLFLNDPAERRLLIPLIGLSSGIGWLIPNVKAMVGSVDVWQTEAITFLSIYLNPLFLAALLLMIGAFYWLELARRQSKARYAVLAGLHLLVLGNVHTYDVLTFACVWTAYLIVLWIVERRFPARITALSILAAGIAAPGIAYQFYVYSVDPVYRARANSPIPSPPVWSFFEGYGLVLLGAIVGGVLLVWKAESGKWKEGILLLSWAVIGFAAPYMPIAQQRKLVMGLHIPLCILCAYALAVLWRKVPRSQAKLLITAVVLFTAVTNVRFMNLDISLMAVGRTVTHYVPFLSRSEIAAMSYLRGHAGPDDVVMAPPTFALFTPALAGRQVYYGHWSETPDYESKFAEWQAFADPNLNTGAWLYILQDSGATYYVSEDKRTNPPKALAGVLRKRFVRGNVAVFEVREPAGSAGQR